MSSCNVLAEELEVLKSIYNNDLKSNGSTIIITLFPLQEEEKKEIHAQVDLYIECSEFYPKKEPVFYLKNVKGLSNSQIEILYCKLKKLSISLIGEVMIYNLAHFVQEFLSENNKPGKKSCYEEMIIRKEQQKQKEYQTKVHKLTNLIKNIEEKQKEMLQSTENNSSEDDNEGENDDFSMTAFKNIKLRSNIVVQMEETPCEHRNCKYIQFNNKVLRGSCIEHDTNSIIYCAIDKTTGDQLLLQEWLLKPKEKNSETSAIIQGKLESIQNQLGNLKKLCHENLISYIDFKWYFEKGEYVVHILQEYVTGVSLNVLIEKNFDLNFIRHTIYEIFKALDYLHSHDVVHGCLNESSIYISKLGVVKVANYKIKKMIDSLHQFCKFGESIELNEVSQKNDILEIGHLLLKITKVLSVSMENIMIPDFQPPELKEFIEKCLIESEEGRWSARKLLSHKFLKIREPKLSIPRKKLSAGEDLEINSEVLEKPYDIFFDGNQNVNSRLTKEFKILNHLGSGSFGEVLKVKNKLDGSVYAIKAIRLNMKNKQLDKKMIREVKLLSKLNHENVVRYYTSWIETDSASDQESLNEGFDDIDSKLPGKISKSNAIQESEDEDEEEDEEEEDDDEDVCDGVDKIKKEDNSSSFIVFEKGSFDRNSENENAEEEKSREVDRKFQPNRTMYIQMEFCEKSTLRIAINDTASPQLWEDEPRLWRLFREIVEGLAYVHGQGMIHRDLKPENIFLDSSDHVKIGDFGLATISAVSKCFLAFVGGPLGAGDQDASSQNIYDDYHTGKVGTSLYVAPEVDKTFEKSYYNEKVDIYSLGIIFFEMCNGPFATDMERIEAISNLRKPEIILSSFWEEKIFKQRSLVKMLLIHDPKSRPYCAEILEGDYLPPAEFEVEQFQEIMRQTLTNPKSKAYKYLVSSCFEQEVRIEDDITYQWENVRSEKQHFILDLIKNRTEKILKNHGAVYLSAPLLLPQNKEYRNVDSRVKLMTHSGSIVNLPYDLRISFARYVACKAFTRLRRYVVERVYKEKKVHGLHPKEQYECAFDIITPPSGIGNAELEVFTVVQEIINDFKSLKNRNCVIRINHTLLLKAVLIHFNSEKWYRDIFNILAHAKETKNSKRRIEINLQQLGIQSSNILFNLLTKENSFSNIKKELFSFIAKKGKALNMLTKAFDQLAEIIGKAEGLGIKVPIKIGMGVVCNSEHCSDIMFDVAYHVKQKKKKEETIVLMSGCRYDELIAKFRRWFELTGPGSGGDDSPSAVGVTVFLDKIAGVLKEDNVLSEHVVICAFGGNVLAGAKEAVAKKLRECGIKCYVEEIIQSLEELTDYCRENKIVHIVNLKGEESGVGYVMSWDDDRSHYLEKKINVRDVADHILKHSKTSETHSSPLASRHFAESQNKPQANEGSLNMEVHIISEDKLTQRKKWENQLRTRISALAGIFSSRARLEVVGVFLDEQRLKDVVLNFRANDSSGCCIRDMESLADRNAVKKYVLKISTKLRSLLSENPNTVIILYSLPQDKYHVILDC